MTEADAGRHDGAFAGGVLVATVLGLALRAYHLAIPLRYDEAVTFVSYASQGFAHAATHYPTPNNHILHTLLVQRLTEVLGPHVFHIRLPAFVAGCLLVPATAWMASRLYDRRAGVLSAFLVAAAPILVEYSSNARGYSMVALATVLAVAVGWSLLRRPTSGAWIVLGLLGIVGLYTVPIMLLPWAGITVWLWVNLFVGGGGWRDRLRRELPLVAVNGAVAAAVVLLYLPVVRINGLDALTGNRFVAAMGSYEFLRSVPGAVAAVASHWTRAVPWPLVLVAGGGLGALLLRREDDRRFPLGWSLLIGVVAVMIAKRNPGEARIWLWALPLVLAAASAGLVALLDRTVRPTLASVTAAAVGAACAGILAVHLVVDRPLWRSLETGGFMEAEEVAAWLAPRVRPEDAVITDFVSREPLRYYLGLYGIDLEELRGAPDPGGRAWVVVNLHEEDRTARAARRAATLGIPLQGATPMATYGAVEIFGFGLGGGEEEAPGEAPLPSPTGG